MSEKIYLIYPNICVCVNIKILKNSVSFWWVYGVATVESVLVFWLALGQGYIHPISMPKLFWYTCNYKAIKQYHSLPTLNNQSSSIVFERWRLCFDTRLRVTNGPPTFKASSRFPINKSSNAFKVTYYQRETHLQKLSKCIQVSMKPPKTNIPSPFEINAMNSVFQPTKKQQLTLPIQKRFHQKPGQGSKKK